EGNGCYALIFPIVAVAAALAGLVNLPDYASYCDSRAATVWRRTSLGSFASYQRGDVLCRLYGLQNTRVESMTTTIPGLEPESVVLPFGVSRRWPRKSNTANWTSCSITGSQ